jgi:hypothetical protein
LTSNAFLKVRNSTNSPINRQLKRKAEGHQR